MLSIEKEREQVQDKAKKKKKKLKITLKMKLRKQNIENSKCIQKESSLNKIKERCHCYDLIVILTHISK